jgi:hypothetical protein
MVDVEADRSDVAPDDLYAQAVPRASKQIPQPDLTGETCVAGGVRFLESRLSSR